MPYYFYQINRRTWKVMDHDANDVGRLRELGAGE